MDEFSLHGLLVIFVYFQWWSVTDNSLYLVLLCLLTELVNHGPELLSMLGEAAVQAAIAAAGKRDVNMYVTWWYIFRY